MINSPFFHGIIVIVLGIGCYVGGAVGKIPELTETGKLLVPLGVGYMGGNAVAKAGN